MSGPSQDLKARILSAAQKAPSPTRADLRRRLGLVLGFAALVVSPVVFIQGLPSAQGRPRAYLVAVFATLLGLLALSTSALVSWFRRPLGPPARLRTAAIGLVLPSFALGLVIAGLVAPETVHAPLPGLRPHLFCPSAVSLCGALIAAALSMALARQEPLRPERTAALIGTWSGLVALVAVTLSCSAVDPVHVGLAHMAPVLMLAFVTRKLARRVLGAQEASSARQT